MKKINLFLLICLTASIVLGSFNLPIASAYSQNNIDSEQIKIRTLPNNSTTPIDRSNTALEKSKNLSQDTPAYAKETATLKDSQQIRDTKKGYVEGEIIIKYKKDKVDLKTITGRSKAENFSKNKSIERKEDLSKNNISVAKIKDGKSVEDKIAELKNDSNIEYVQPNFQYYPTLISTNDTYKNNLWGLDNYQPVNGVSGTPDADIDAPEAWAINEGTNLSVIVAVIDSGVAYNHPDLINNMWDGTNCRDENGSPLNGCNHGYDYENSDKTPLPTTSSHGTHIAGTIAATKSNGLGIIGVAPQAKIMALKTNYTTSQSIKAINFAQQNGAKVINASWGDVYKNGSYSPHEYLDQGLYDAIAGFSGLFIAAAGNDAQNHDSGNSGTKMYPAAFDLTNIISVAATDQNDNMVSFSDYGATSVDVGAPGKNIYSTVINEAGSNVLNETFGGVITPAVPSGWVKSGTNNNWGTIDATSWLNTIWGKVLYGDVLNYPYVQTANSTITSSNYNLSNSTAKIDFWTRCDTEYNMSSWTDYMALEFSNDGGSNFTEVLKWDEPFIDLDANSSGAAIYHFANLSIPSQYLTNNFKFRLRWVANGNADTGNGDGCLVDDIVITKFTDKDGSDGLYGYSDGTSMATPHVVGLAALIWGYKPALSYTEVKNTILNTGDSVASLSGKTVSGKRINAYSALNSLTSTGYTISGTVKYYDLVKKVSGATVVLENGVGAQLATTTTDVNGAYQFTNVAGGGNYVVRASKTDGAAGLSSADQIKIGRHIVGLEIFDSVYKNIAGDVNNTCSLSSADQIKIGRFIVGLDTSLPSGAWKFYSSSASLTTLNYLSTGLTRTYINLTSNMSSQNFVGIKMGDVNNSWN